MDARSIQVKLDERNTSPYVYHGMGVQWDPYNVHPVTDEEWQLITKRVDYLSPYFVRLMIYAPTYCRGFNLAGEPVYQFDCPAVRSLLRELDYLESRGIMVVLGEWEAPGRFGGVFEGINAGHPAWAKIISGLLKFLIVEKGYTCIRYFNYVNEANSEWSWCADYDQWQQGIAYLHEQLCKLGIENRIGIVGPDSVWDEGNSWLRRIAADRETDARIALYDVHMYPTIEEIQSGDIQRQIAEQRALVSGKDFYMTEVGMVTGKAMGDSQTYIREFCYGVLMADVACQVINGGFAGVSIWDLDDAMHNQGNGYPREDIRSLKQWGFWNSVAGRVFGQPEEERIRPHFFTWSLMCRLFKYGSTVYVPQFTGAEGSALRVLAMSKDGRAAVMLVNDGHEDLNIGITLPKCQNACGAWEKYEYVQENLQVDADGFPVCSGRIQSEKGTVMVRLEKQSVVFLAEV